MNIIELKEYDSSNKLSDMDYTIEHGLENILTIQNMSHKINVKNEIIIPDRNMLEQYKNFILDRYCVWVAIPEELFYKPELVAYKIYGTVDLWYLVLWTAQVPSAMEFNKTPVKIFDPQYFNVINDILNRHYDEFKLNSSNPELVEDLTLTKVKVKDTRYI